MATCRLTQHRVDNLKPGTKTRDIRDKELRGFGVRILPSGRKRYFLHNQISGQRVWHAIGDARDITLVCARSKARSLLASRLVGDDSTVCGQVLFEAVAEEVFRRYRAAHPRSQPQLLQEPDPALVQGHGGCGHLAYRHSQVVCLAPCNACGSGPLGTCSLGDSQAGRGLRVSSRRIQSLSRHQALSPAGP